MAKQHEAVKWFRRGMVHAEIVKETGYSLEEVREAVSEATSRDEIIYRQHYNKRHPELKGVEEETEAI